MRHILRLMEVLFTPADYEALGAGRLSDAVCVVFDVLRATSSMVTALFHGAVGIHPVRSIAEAVRFRQSQPDYLLAGERGGVRIRADEAGGMDFDLGNSPREFAPAVVAGRNIVMTTTNGTRALHACREARTTLVCSFLNLTATADYLVKRDAQSLWLICSGTGEQAAYEDTLCAGALVDVLNNARRCESLTDSALIAHCVYQAERANLEAALGRAANAQRLIALPGLRDDVAFCAHLDRFPVVAGTTCDAPITVLKS